MTLKGKKGQVFKRVILGAGLALLIFVILASITGNFFGKTVEQLNAISAASTLSGCPIEMDGNFPIVTRDNYVLAAAGGSGGVFGTGVERYDGGSDADNEWRTLVGRCGLCVGKEGDVEALYFLDVDIDHIPDKCERPEDINPVTPFTEWPDICSQVGGVFVYLAPGEGKPRCCLEGAEQYCQGGSER